ncbi:hypothetical protein ABT288_32655 [Streptomyces sp. NPDC001093]|uniref:hypothetical protein n=1 Tax=Streptomyces sp. NPDC001093 TaxID=3154376 RepID=UPI0033299F39
MERAHPLDGLDAQPWPDFSHAYGTAEDLPDLLRALTGPDDDAAAAALSELYGSVLHQGTVYAASAHIAPFLARIAASGHRTADLLTLLGGMAESEDEHGVPQGTVRAAVTEQLALLLPLLDAAEPEVRRAAAWAVSHTRATATVLPALRGRWDEESEPSVRSAILAAMSRLDARAGAEAAATVLEPSQPPELRLAAVFACLDANLPWTGQHHSTLLSLLPADELVSDGFDLDRAEPLAAVVEALLGRDRETDREAVFALLDAALRDGRAEVRAEALWAADRACMLSRSAPRRLLAGLIEATTEEEGVVAAASLLGRLGTAAAPAASVLAPLAGRSPDRADDHADRALAALVLVAPAQAVPLLARGLGRRPRALDAAAGFLSPVDVVLPYDTELLEAVRRRLSRPGSLSGNEPGQLTKLLAGWGARAASALPELYALLPHFPGQAATAIIPLARDCGPGERQRAATALRATAERGSLRAAKALYDLVGEPEPLLACLARELRRDSRDLQEAAGTAGALGPRAGSLVPVLQAALAAGKGSTVTPALDADTSLAEALWRITGDAPTVVEALDSVFARAAQSPWARWSAVRAARATALLGPAGRPLTARLEALLGDPEQVPAAVLALAAVAEPAPPPRTGLATAVLDAVEQEADPTGALDALQSLGSASLAPRHLARLAVLADGDARVIRSGVEGRIIREDEAFRERARRLLAVLTADGTRP